MTSVAAIATAKLSKIWRTAPADARLSRWGELMKAALMTPYYQEPARQDSILECISRTTLPGFLEALSRMEPVMLHEFFLQIREFRNRSAGELPAQAASGLWEPEGRLAVVEPWFRVAAPARVWTRVDPAALAHFDPDVVAAPVETLRRLSETGWSGPGRAIVTLTGICREWLDEEGRGQLWNRFGVPVYEQFRGFQGELLAADCEAHEGMHVVADHGHMEVVNGELVLTSLVDVRYPVLRLAAGIRARLEPSHCGCGRTAARLEGPARRRVLARAAGV
jgi:hypothetical protein